MQVRTSPKWLYSIGSHQETHVFLLTSLLFWRFFGHSSSKSMKTNCDGMQKLFFYPRSSMVLKFLPTFIISSIPQKVGEPFPFPWFAMGYMLPKLCMSPTGCVWNPFTRASGSFAKKWRNGPRQQKFPLGGKLTCLNWGWIWRLFMFPVFFAKSCELVC